MIDAAQALARYGDPRANEGKHMILWDVPEVMERSAIPGRIYINRDLRAPLARAIVNLIARRQIDELRTWDGCFNIRNKRGSSTPSLHSWGLAVDVNASWNQLGHPSSLSPAFVQCWIDAGFDWGGIWKRPDGMHFQLREFPQKEG